MKAKDVAGRGVRGNADALVIGLLAGALGLGACGLVFAPKPEGPAAGATAQAEELAGVERAGLEQGGVGP